ncbi:acetylcholinesterase-1-like [Stegodyphus dumicola]|uniref:acetylcholinesterase-1-like n=1 Tax=Stegodyphus dumicola TaxID=202533 RepID=UPI0015B059E4|nr:acetylcholinesterase-1-like [Stegodyphus dumicola]
MRSFQKFFITCGSLLYILCFEKPIFCMRVPMINTKLGTIIGTNIYIDGILVNQYLGIPYAKPPVDKLRFKKPEKIEEWISPRNATKQPPACIQYTPGPFPSYDDKPGKSEDCLYLNIWTPSNASDINTKAVFYWIYGGGFSHGSIRKELYGGEVVSAVGDVIVVTVNYRLGPFGFLFADSSDAPGNVGIWDILTGLEWVKENIEAFGGDISRITVAGESAGSIAVGLLSVSPLARGLYTRQILQSGTPAYTAADNNTQNLNRSQLLAELIGCANETYTIQLYPKNIVECLRGIDAMELIMTEATLDPYSNRRFIPQFGDELLPNNPRESIINGDFQNNVILIGNTRDEGSSQITTQNREIFGFFGEKNPQINKTFGKDMIRKIFAKLPDREAVVRQYLPDEITEDQYELVRRQVHIASGDYSRVCPSVYFAEKYAEKGNNVFFYVWDHRPSPTPWAPWMGVVHFTENQFVFGSPIKHPEKYVPEEVQLSSDMIKYWTNFAKTGKPTDFWPLYSKDNPRFKYLSLDQKEMGNGPHHNNCDFFRPYFGFQ